MLSLLVGFGLIAMMGLLAAIRLAPIDPVVWHVDPTAIMQPQTRNHWLVAASGDAPVLHVDLPPDVAAQKLWTIALAFPGTSVLAGEGTFVTYITRSRLMGYPDLTSVKVTAAQGGADVAIFARSRFGSSDFGVNRARVEAWVAQLKP
ncbi:MAG: DUF1499 domain-containing protein [Paracoccaceae bacterium]